ncbi:MAG: alpha-galactosidase [Clostridia bacterium]|nr:alpha-galactosidase [Clostridia bacterium]
MKLTYTVCGERKTTELSNGDIEIIDRSEGENFRFAVKAKTAVTLERAEAEFPCDYRDGDLFFMNGYQSWTDTKEFTAAEKEKNIYKAPKFLIKKFGFDMYGDATFYPYESEKLHGYDLFYLKGEKEKFVFNRNEGAYLIAELYKKKKVLTLMSDVCGARLSPNDETTVFDCVITESYDGGKERFFAAYPEKKTEKIFGYTSWYNYYQNIDERVIMRDLGALDERFNLFQIDDGYQTFVGDWKDINKEKFPDGLENIVEKIHCKGMKAGVWLAPFVAEKNSKLFRERKDLFKKDGNGEPIFLGSNWSGFYPLDLQNAEAREYIADCLNYFVSLGFDFFKLDFLYAASVVPFDGKTRCRTASEAYAFLREVLKDKLILGCGATLYNAAGVFDYMRVGPDVSLKFDDVWFMKFFHRERISTKNTLQNTVYRHIFDGRFFGNDPDVFLLRDENLHLTAKQKEALITLNALFGSVLMTSDNVGGYDDDKRRTLAAALDIFRNAKDADFARKGKNIEITYRLGGAKNKIIYDTERGVLL